MPSICQLQEQRKNLAEQLKVIHERAEAEGRDYLSKEEEETFDKIESEINTLQTEIQKKQGRERLKNRLVELEEIGNQPMPRQVSNLGKQEVKTLSTPVSIQWRSDQVCKRQTVQPLSFDPGTAEHLRSQPEYLANFRRYIVGGNAEQLGLKVSDDTKGGYLVPVDMAAGLIKFLDDNVVMRQIATVLPPTSAKSIGALSFDTDYADGDWTAEVPASAISEDDAARFGKRELSPHMLTKLVKVSRKFLRSSSIAPEAFISERAGYKFAITENKKFLSGSGAQQPLGVFTASASGISTGRDFACAGTTDYTIDDLIGCKGNVKFVYQQRGSWLVHRDFLTRLRKKKDGVAQYYYGLNGNPDRLLDSPVYVDENAPNTFTTGQYIALFGDFSFYWIVDGLGMEMQRLDELYSTTNQVGFIFRKETDGMPVLGEAFSRLVLA